MSIKLHGGVFGRNPTFNDVEVQGSISVGGNTVPAPNTILVDSDIGSTVQAYDADTTKNDVANTFTQTQVFDQSVGVGVAAGSILNKVDVNGAVTLKGAHSTFIGANIGVVDVSGSGKTRVYSLGPDASTPGEFGIYCYSSNTGAGTERLAIDSSGNIQAVAGNFVIGTSGKGIDFSATGDGSGTTDNELFDDYEEGTWTPIFTSWSTTGTTSVAGTYTKVGNVVVVTGQFRSVTGSIASTGGSSTITGLPFSISGYMSFTVSPGQGATNGGVGANSGDTLYAPTISSTFNDIYFQATYHTS